MKTNIKIKKLVSVVTMITLLGTNLAFINNANATSNSLQFPLKKVAKLNYRYTDFEDLKSNQKQNIPILKTKDYSRYIKKNGGYNDYTRYYTTLWGASYKYGWDVGFGGHEGTDIVSSKGTPIYSIADGKVIVAKKALGWGNVVTIEHTIYGKKVFSNYAHMSKILVKKGQSVKAGKQIGEMGSTGNSTGNHVHFQIDLDTPFHPYYYSRKTCPYSYYEITEKGLCFDDLQANTIDPLLFFETNGEIVKKLNVKINKVSVNKNPTKVYNPKKNYDKDGVTKKYSTSIWNKTVYVGYSTSDIKEVQQILIDLKLYKGRLTGNYKDIEDIIFKFQVSKNILKVKSDNGAGWFGPKTRAAIKKEYDKLSSNQKNIKLDYEKEEIKKEVTNTGIVTKKIERKNLKTREQLEQEEIDNFLKSYEFELNLNASGENLRVGTSAKIDFKILKSYTKNKKRKKYFKGITPQNITIFTDTNILKPFPKQFSSLTGDGKREIILKGLKPGVSNVKIMFGNKIVKTYKIRVYSSNEKIYLKSGKIYGKSSANSGESVRGIALFTDKTNKRLIGVKYSGNYKIKGVGDTKICVKSGSAKYISRIYHRKCRADEYKSEIDFDYSKTVSGILLFDYKSDNGNGKVEIINKYNNSTLASKSLNILARKTSNISYVR